MGLLGLRNPKTRVDRDGHGHSGATGQSIQGLVSSESGRSPERDEALSSPNLSPRSPASFHLQWLL